MLRGESHQSVQRRRSVRPRAKSRRLRRHLPAERRSGRPSIQLAARASGQIRPVAARVHARRGHSPWRVHGAAGCRSKTKSMTGYQHLLLFGSVVVAACFLVVYFWPSVMLSLYKRAILVKGFGEGPIPVNTLYAEPQAVFADPLRAAPASGSNLITTGVNRDTLLTGGWLDLRKAPQVLHVPDMGGRYYSAPVPEPANNTNFAYFGQRVT